MIEKNIFRAYDIRGIFGKTITPKIMETIGRELRKMFPKDSFLLGNDIRASSEELAGALIKGLSIKGGNVKYSGTTAFGESLFSGLKLNVDKSLYITASHSPPEWNGLKCYYGDGEAFPSKIIYELAERVSKRIDSFKEDQEYTKYLNKVGKVDFKNKYIEFLKNNFEISKKIKVVIDCGNGSTCLTAPKVFKELGFEVIQINGKVDPKFSGRTSNIKPELLTDLFEKVKSENADFGVAFDGDGDRFIVVDEKGQPHNSSTIGILIAKYLIPNSKKKKIIITLPVSMAAETELKPLGSEVIRVPVGHTYIINNTKKQDALIGLEESGHMVLSDYFYFDDGLIPPLKTAELMCKTGKKLSDLVKEIPKYPFEEITFKCEDNKKFKFIDYMYNKLLNNYENVSKVDGLRINFKDGWILLRASNTGPKIRLYIEATSNKKFNELKNKFIKLFSEEIKKW